MLFADKISPVIIEIGNFSIRWYAIFILIGAVLTLVFSQWAMKRGGYSKDLLNTLFFIAFPMDLSVRDYGGVLLIVVLLGRMATS